MQYLLFIDIVVAFFVLNAQSYTIPDATVKLLRPKGFRLSIPDEDGITDVSFNVKIDQRITLYQPGDFAAIIKETTDDVWAFDNINTSISPGSTINYWVHVQFGKLGKNFRDVGTAIVSKDAVEISTFCPNVGQSANPECPATDKSDCEPSVTTVGGRLTCKGQLVFEDDFDTLDVKKWSREVRIPLASDDGQFVSFQNRPENAFVNSGMLHIIPSLLSEARGFDAERIISGQMDLESDCTAIVDRFQECKKQAQYFQILPPIVSARMRTKASFSFRFGRIEIRAKLPRGDWLFPLMLLEPMENYYGATSHASGQMRIAFNRGNDVLEANSKDISSQWLSGGVVMSTGEKTRSAHLNGQRLMTSPSDDFHNYTLTWTEDQIALGYDGREYAVLKENFSQIQKRYHGYTSGHQMAPFDREFFITLGVSAGGHSDFPESSRNGRARSAKPWTNGDPKAELYFWKDRGNWYKTWNSETRGLYVDFVRVFAL